MTNSPDIFQLIKSLENSEKRYFKLFTSQQKGNKNYLKLFELIEKQPHYDEVKLLKKIKFSQSLDFSKNYLYKMILKSLRAYHEQKSPEAQVHNLLTEINILEQKGLPRQGLKLIRRAKKIAIKYDFPHLLNKLFIKEISLSFTYKPKKLETEVQKLIKKSEHFRKRSQLEDQLYCESSNWVLLSRKKELEKTTKQDIIEKWQKTELILPSFKNLSFLGKTYYLNIKSYEAQLKKNNQICVVLEKK